MCFFKQCKQDFHPGSDTDSAGDNSPCTQPTHCKRTWVLRPVCLQWKTSAGNCCTSSIDSGSTLIMEPTKWMATTSSTDLNQSVGSSFRYFYFWNGEIKFPWMTTKVKYFCFFFFCEVNKAFSLEKQKKQKKSVTFFLDYKFFQKATIKWRKSCFTKVTKEI